MSTVKHITCYDAVTDIYHYPTTDAAGVSLNTSNTLQNYFTNQYTTKTYTIAAASWTSVGTNDWQYSASISGIDPTYHQVTVIPSTYSDWETATAAKIAPFITVTTNNLRFYALSKPSANINITIQLLKVLNI